MPEIWLPYGDVEVAVDIRAENLGEILKPNLPLLDQEAIVQQFSELPFSEDLVILLADGGKPVHKVLQILLDVAKNKASTPTLTVITSPRDYSSTKSLCGSLGANVVKAEGLFEFGTADGLPVLLPKEFSQHHSRIVLSSVGFDPLFGFTGGPVSIIKTFSQNMLPKAFKDASLSLPTPGSLTEAHDFAMRVGECLSNTHSVEVTSSVSDVSAVHVGSLQDAHEKASKTLLSACSHLLNDAARAVVATPGGGDADSTLASSLTCLWNVADAVREKGIVALIAECSHGLGSRALERYVSGRLKVEDALKEGGYVEGLEDLVYLLNLQQHKRLVLVSTLPHYYAENILGFQVSSKVDDALSYVLSNLGSRAKVLIAPQGTRTLLQLRRE